MDKVPTDYFQKHIFKKSAYFEPSGSQTPSQGTNSRGKTEGLHYTFAISRSGSRDSKYMASVEKYQYTGRTSKNIHVISQHVNHLLKANHYVQASGKN